MQRYVIQHTLNLRFASYKSSLLLFTLSEPGVGDGTGGIYFYPLGSVRERGHCMDC